MYKVLCFLQNFFCLFFQNQKLCFSFFFNNCFFKDSTHKFIRTAELKFKVKSVIKSTYDIEDIKFNKNKKLITHNQFFYFYLSA